MSGMTTVIPIASEAAQRAENRQINLARLKTMHLLDVLCLGFQMPCVWRTPAGPVEPEVKYWLRHPAEWAESHVLLTLLNQ